MVPERVHVGVVGVEIESEAYVAYKTRMAYGKEKPVVSASVAADDGGRSGAISLDARTSFAYDARGKWVTFKVYGRVASANAFEVAGYARFPLRHAPLNTALRTQLTLFRPQASSASSSSGSGSDGDLGRHAVGYLTVTVGVEAATLGDLA